MWGGEGVGKEEKEHGDGKKMIKMANMMMLMMMRMVMADWTAKMMMMMMMMMMTTTRMGKRIWLRISRRQSRMVIVIMNKMANYHSHDDEDNHDFEMWRRRTGGEW